MFRQAPGRHLLPMFDESLHQVQMLAETQSEGKGGLLLPTPLYA